MATLTLEHIAMRGRPYPTHLLEGCETGLVLFAAAFLGHNDAVHFAEAGIKTWCIDVDGTKLEEMEGLYPDDWEFVHGDAWTWAGLAQHSTLRFDVVSVDTFTGDTMERSLGSLELWCSLANKAVTVTITDDVEHVELPEGWTASLYPRSDNVSWLVLERE